MNHSPHRVLLGCAVAAVVPFFVLLSSLSGVAWAAEDAPKMCVMMYMVADNDLELAILQDLFEYFDSDTIAQPNVKTWIYWDGHGGFDYDGDGEADHTLILGGEPAIVPHILTYDHSMQDIISYPLDGEQNSDAPQVLCDFLYTALDGCLEFGATEFMLAFSSHGSGYRGFGGDDHTGRRRLYQSNHDMQRALECALDSVADVPNAPRVFDVIGFDACFMGSFLTARDYAPYTKYFMASEALEPGHGWWWNISSSAAGGAITMATELLDSFLTETQNPEGTHLVPKTLSIIQTDLFETFLVEFEAFVSDLADLLVSGKDPDFFTAMQRSRASVIVFESAADHPGSRTPSAVDVGSFLSTFHEICAPTGGLKEAYERTQKAYNAQFHARGYGKGTKNSTGMAVWFPDKKLYSAAPWSVESEIFQYIDDGETSYAWLDFIDVFLNTTWSGASVNSSVCANSFASAIRPKFRGQMLLNPSIYIASVGIEARSEITRNCDSVLTEYGFIFFDISSRRHLQKILKKAPTPITPVGKRIMKNRLRGSRSSDAIATKRSVQEDDYLIVINGAMSSKYRRSTYFGYWDELIYVLTEDTDDGVANLFLYADNLGDGAFSIPVIYFPPDIQVDSNILPPMGSVTQDALNLGGVFAELTFSTDVTTGLVVSPISLYVEDEDGSSTYEKPRSQGGSLAPIVYGEVLIGLDVAFPEFIGALHAWGDHVSVQPVALDTYGDLIGLDFMVFDMYAYDFDKGEDEIGFFDFSYFDFNITDRTLNSSVLLYDDDYFDYMFEDTETTGNQNTGKGLESNTSHNSGGVSGGVLGLALLPCLLLFFFNLAV
jgi:hypothetical protein